jgi:hypothetical protein
MSKNNIEHLLTAVTAVTALSGCVTNQNILPIQDDTAEAAKSASLGLMPGRESQGKSATIHVVYQQQPGKLTQEEAFKQAMEGAQKSLSYEEDILNEAFVKYPELKSQWLAFNEACDEKTRSLSDSKSEKKFPGLVSQRIDELEKLRNFVKRAVLGGKATPALLNEAVNFTRTAAESYLLSVTAIAQNTVKDPGLLQMIRQLPSL